MHWIKLKFLFSPRYSKDYCQPMNRLQIKSNKFNTIAKGVHEKKRIHNKRKPLKGFI